MPGRLIDLVKPGQTVRIVNIQNAGKCDLTIFSKRKKLEYLAIHQKLLRQREAQLKARDGGGPPIRFVSSNSGLSSVYHVGEDFIAFTNKPTELLIIPLSSIRQIKFEQTEEDIETFGDSFEAFAVTNDE